MPILSDAELRNARAFETHWTRIKQTWAAVGEKATATLAPAMERIAIGMDKWIKANKHLIESGLEKFLKGVGHGVSEFARFIATIYGWLTRVVPLLKNFVGELGETDSIAKILFAALLGGASAFIIINAQIIAVTAGVTALVLVLKDMYDLLTGNDSHLGRAFTTADAQIEYLKSKYPRIGRMLGFNTGQHQEDLDKAAGIDSHKYDDVIKTASVKYGVDEALIKAVIRAESQFNPNAKSPAGAQGLMQLMPDTAAGLGVKDSYDPEQNIMGGTKYLAELMDKYNGRIGEVLTAYNWGSGNLDKALKRGSEWRPEETKAYVDKILGPMAAGGNPGGVGAGSTINITNNITGDNAVGIASETARTMSNTLQTLFPGGLVPVTN